MWACNADPCHFVTLGIHLFHLLPDLLHRNRLSRTKKLNFIVCNFVLFVDSYVFPARVQDPICGCFLGCELGTLFRSMTWPCLEGFMHFNWSPVDIDVPCIGVTRTLEGDDMKSSGRLSELERIFAWRITRHDRQRTIPLHMVSPRLRIRSGRRFLTRILLE